VPLIFHLARTDDWVAAQLAGEYRISTLGLTLDEVGFIHCSDAEQVDGVARAFYGDVEDLVLLTIDTDRVGHEIRVEAAGAGNERFPHIYGPLAVDAVVAVEPFAMPA
jgi:glutathione S-transferase